jgi:hypothetical protein
MLHTLLNTIDSRPHRVHFREVVVWLMVQNLLSSFYIPRP